MSLIDDLNTICKWLMQELQKTEILTNQAHGREFAYYVQHPDEFVNHSCELQPSFDIEPFLLDPDLLEQGSYKPRILIQSKDQSVRFIISLPIDLLNKADQCLLTGSPQAFNRKLLPQAPFTKMALITTSVGRFWITDFFHIDQPK